MKPITDDHTVKIMARKAGCWPVLRDAKRAVCDNPEELVKAFLEVGMAIKANGIDFRLVGESASTGRIR